MDYPPDAFEALIAEVEHQGGALLPDPCVPHRLDYPIPPYSKVPKPIPKTCGCKNVSRVVFTYDAGKPKGSPPPSGSGYVTACAVCDGVGAMPRFCEAVYAIDPTLNPCYDDSEEEQEDDE